VLEDRSVPAVTGLHIVPSPTVAQSFLNATAAITASNVWAVGETTASAANKVETPLVEHFNGTSWSVIPTPALPPGNFGMLSGVTAIASNDVWAVGETGNISPFSALIEHWDGTAWRIVSSPTLSGGAQLNAVTAFSSSNVWAVGQSPGGFSQSNLIEHYDGTSWSVVPAPAATSGNLFGVSGTSGSDIWAVGKTGRHASVQVLHYDGTAWSTVPAPSPHFGSSLASVTALAPNNVWAVGTTNVGPTQTLIEHWDGTSWSVVPSPNGGNGTTNANNSLSSIAAVSANDIWAVGTFTNPATGLGQTLTEHWDGTSWTIIPSPNASTTGTNALLGVTALSDGTVIAVGYAISSTTQSSSTNALILSS
jgi:hypothetical protein